jgi:hypothetical protein
VASIGCALADVRLDYHGLSLAGSLLLFGIGAYRLATAWKPRR